MADGISESAVSVGKVLVFWKFHGKNVEVRELKAPNADLEAGEDLQVQVPVHAVDLRTLPKASSEGLRTRVQDVKAISQQL